jgi:hypothetical protein
MKPDLFRRLAAGGLSTEQIALVLEIMDEEAEERRANGRARWRKHQDKKRNANVSKREPTFAANSRAVEDKTSSSEIEPQDRKNTPQAALERVLDAERAAQVVAHRARLRKPLTPYAAKLLAKQIEACPIPADAADAMIANGWQGVKPEWMLPHNQRAGPRKPNIMDALNAMDAAENVRRTETTEAAVFYLPAAAGR